LLARSTNLEPGDHRGFFLYVSSVMHTHTQTHGLTFVLDRVFCTQVSFYPNFYFVFVLHFCFLYILGEHFIHGFKIGVSNANILTKGVQLKC